jgi:argininosuccinate lyase
MSQLWGGRFQEETDATFARYNASLRFDRRLIPADVQGSIAYAEGLHHAGVLTREEANTIQTNLEQIARDVEANPSIVDEAVQNGVEDVHSFVEGLLTERIGDLGGRLHTGRSRNDQVATDIRLFTREAIDALEAQCRSVQEGLLTLAERHKDVAIPGYTHLQKAMPVLWAHHMLAYFEMLQRDRERLHDIRKRVNRCPLGSAAMAGTSYPIDRHKLATDLGFDDITHNSMDGVSDRDFIVELIGACALVMTHLSRLCEDFIVFASTEFGFVTFSDKVATGSSIMPQKKNPDALELIRGKTGRVVGHQMSLLTTLKGLPLCYNKDMQEDKEPLFDTVDTVMDSLAVMKIVLDETSVREERCAQAARRDYLNATEVADYLVHKGAPFRQAHGIAGRVVLDALAQEKQLEELSLNEYKAHSDYFDEDIYDAISLAATLEAKNVPGGTAPTQVEQALVAAKQRLAS